MHSKKRTVPNKNGSRTVSEVVDIQKLVFCTIGNNSTCVSSTVNRNQISIRELNKDLKNGEKLELNHPLISITLEKVSGKHLAGKQLHQPNGVRIRFPELNINQSTIINVIANEISCSPPERLIFFLSLSIVVNHITFIVNHFINVT